MKSSTIATVLALGLLAMTILNSCNEADAHGPHTLGIPEMNPPQPITHPRDVHFRANPLSGTASEVMVVEADSAFKPGDIITLDEGVAVCILERCN